MKLLNPDKKALLQLLQYLLLQHQLEKKLLKEIATNKKRFFSIQIAFNKKRTNGVSIA